ncbi:MAG: DUF2493 domain-containing protein [bacterium]
MSKFKVLVCGDRYWTDRTVIFAALSTYLEELGRDDLLIIQGGAKGADTIARDWARQEGVETLQFDADWQQYGRAAGPIRNKKMLVEKPDLVLAFHEDIRSSKGTLNMVKQAQKAGVTTVIIGSTLEAE